MIKIKVVYINSKDDFSKLGKKINSMQKGFLIDTYEDCKGTIDEIKSALWSDGRKLKVALEYPYYDKEYLNEFANFYCCNFHLPSNKCLRLIFYNKNQQKKYELMGYVVLVPTPSLNHIGRIAIEPKFIIKNASLILTNCKIHFDGRKEVFQIFPHARQYGITACGHISIWEVSKFVGSNWDRYSEKEFEQIVNTVSVINPKNKISPPELTVAQIVGVLSDFGYKPLFKPRGEDNDFAFITELYSYIDSGIPLVLLDGKYNHATVGLGYQRDKEYEFSNSSVKSLPLLEKKNYKTYKIIRSDGTIADIKAFSDKIFYRSVILNDDNSFPYRAIQLYNNTQNDNKVNLSLLNLFGFIVPLYPRINLEFSDVEDYSKILIRRQGVEVGFISENQQEVFVRIFLTSANKCREHIYKQSFKNAYAKEIYDRLKTIEISKLCWVIEYSSQEEQVNDKISGFSILNSTCSYNDDNVVLMNCGRKMIEYYNDELNEVRNDKIKKAGNLSLNRFDKNLFNI